MASTIKVRGIISMAWFIELGSIFGIEDSAANMKKHTLFICGKLKAGIMSRMIPEKTSFQ
jgi:hypothetical protein